MPTLHEFLSDTVRNLNWLHRIVFVNPYFHIFMATITD